VRAYHLCGQGRRRLAAGRRRDRRRASRQDPPRRGLLGWWWWAGAGGAAMVVVFVWESRVGWTRRPLPSPYYLPRHLFGRGLRAAGQAPNGAPPVSYLSLHPPQAHRKMPCPTTSSHPCARWAHRDHITSCHVLMLERPNHSITVGRRLVGPGPPSS